MDKRREIRRYLRLWIYLLGLEAWQVRWRSGHVQGSGGAHAPYGDAECFPDFDRKRARIVFNPRRMTTEEKIERAVIHELLHLWAREETEEVHQMIRRAERYIRRIRLRLSAQ